MDKKELQKKVKNNKKEIIDLKKKLSDQDNQFKKFQSKYIFKKLIKRSNS